MNAVEARDFMLRLPQVTEYDHGGLPAFRVAGKRFASMLDADGMNLMPGEEAIRAAAALWPTPCYERFFAGRLTSVGVSFAALDDGVAEELIYDAWAHRAPRRLHAEGLQVAQQTTSQR